ncbi:GNAT family N-acetyltransferase [Streptomyces alkaliphilus]|uniref:GNAT family N-acetyltransferase n=2 Tax=Streptomyces alkaliphilus TaxID=1472722 RepID=A0A7W3TEI1_9ACTN|nr:GNAT family N-acetyltransferase [Streptomyces alkaliphilus]
MKTLDSVEPLRLNRGYLAIRPAHEREAAKIAALWSDAARWLDGRGYDQWQYPPNMSRIHDSIVHGTAYIAEMEDGVVGTITLDGAADPEFWHANDFPLSALYIHRMIVSEVARGRQVGSSMLDWASARAERAGVKFVRLDAWKRNYALQDYYRSNGFTHVRTIDLPHRNSGALFQREAGTFLNAGPSVVDLEFPTHTASGAPIEGRRGAIY